MADAQMKNFEYFTSFLGDYGFFQILMIVLLSLSSVPLGYMAVISVFVADTPEYHCKGSINSTRNDSWIGPDSCSRYKVKKTWAQPPALSNDTEPCLDGWVFSTDIYTSTIVSEWGLVCDEAWKVPFSTSAFFLGCLIGSLLSGHLSDRFGRKPVFFVTMVLLAVSTLIQAASVNWVMFCILNSLRGLGFIPGYIVSIILGSEMLSTSARVTYAAVCHSVGYGTGYALLPLFAYFIRDWRLLLVASAIPIFLIIPMWWVIPESPRWLLHNGRIKEAEQILHNAAKMNNIPVPETIFKDEEDLELMREKGEKGTTYNYVDLLRNPNLRNITILGAFLWILVPMVFYGLSLNTSNLNGNIYLNCFISAAIDITAYVTTWLLASRVPRPTLLFCTMMFCGLTLLGIQFVPGDMQVVFQVLALLGKIGVAGAYCYLYVFFTELFPTVVRNMGISITSTAARIGTCVCPYILYFGLYMKVLPFIIFGIFSIMAAAISMLLPDTRNCKLPDLLSETKPIKRCCCAKEKAHQDGREQPEA